MVKKKLTLFAPLVALTLIAASINVRAQATAVFASGLIAPTKILVTPGGSLVVTEAGNGPNTGRVSIIDQNGNRRTLITGLPSGFAPPTGDPSGPAGVDLRRRTLYIGIGAGDATVAGPVPGTELPNPNPSSPLFSAVLALTLSRSVEETAGGFTLALADLARLKTGLPLRLTNAAGEELLVELVADFRNFTFEFRSDVPNNVRPSNPFALVVNGRRLFVADAAQNLVWEVNLNTGRIRDLLPFPPKPNPLPAGPRLVDTVPDGIRLFGDQLLVTFLTGAPFVPGLAEVHKINRVNNSRVTFIGGLSSAIDVIVAQTPIGTDQFFVLEFSTNFTAQPRAPGRLLRFDSPSGPPVVIASNLMSPTGMALNPMTRTIFVTEIFTGRVIRVTLP